MSRVAVVVLYVVPLLLTAAALAAVGLEVLALGLLGVEAVVAGAVLLAKRRPKERRAPRDGTTVVLVVGAALVLGLAGLLLLLRATSS